MSLLVEYLLYSVMSSCYCSKRRRRVEVVDVMCDILQSTLDKERRERLETKAAKTQELQTS